MQVDGHTERGGRREVERERERETERVDFQLNQKPTPTIQMTWAADLLHELLL